MENFKVGDRVIVNYMGMFAPECQNEKGEVLFIDNYGTYIIKCDNWNGGFDNHECITSDKNDLLWCENEYLQLCDKNK